MNQNIKTILIPGGIALALLVSIPLIWDRVSDSGGWGCGMTGGFGWGWFMPVLMILFWTLIIWAVVALTRGASPSDSTADYRESAMEVLKRRYARGEIDKKEYEDKRRDLI